MLTSLVHVLAGIGAGAGAGVGKMGLAQVEKLGVGEGVLAQG